MTAKKKVTSIICIISLILAITVGVLLSVGAQPNDYYGGESVRLSNTDVTLNVQSSIKSSTIPDGATEITDLDGLKNFITGTFEGDANYGYLANDIEDVLDWTGVGSQQILSAEKTLDGNGHSITLKDADTGKNAGYADNFDDPLETDSTIKSLAKKRSYGMLVDYNLGTIKNVKFIYTATGGTITSNDQDGSSGDKTMYANYAGIVCGTNTGTIENCDIDVSGGFTYNYVNAKIGDDKDSRHARFAVYWGAIAGRNANVVQNITAEYGDFTVSIYTKAQNTKKGGGTFGLGALGTTARAIAGGIVGVNHSVDSQVKNIIVRSKDNTKINPQVEAVAASKGDNGSAEVGGWGAVVGANSAYSGGAGESEPAQGKIDNVFVDVNADLVSWKKHTMGSTYSINGVTTCGRSTNVTILRTSDRLEDYQTDNCTCGTSSNSGQHSIGYGNLINTDDHSIVTVGFDANNNQVITVECKDKQNAMLGEFSFNKYNGKNAENNGDLDTTVYPDVANNGTTYLYNDKNVRQDVYTFKVVPHQDLTTKYWEINAYSYEIVDIDNAADKAGNINDDGVYTYTYTGKDFLTDQLSFTARSASSETHGTVNPTGFYAVDANGMQVASGRLPGTYTFKLREKEAGLAYVDTTNKVVAYVEDEPTEYSFTVEPAEVTSLKADGLGLGGEYKDWMTERVDFTFAVDGGIEGAADGYVYESNGSLPTQVNNLTMLNARDTSADGRSYKVYLTSGGVRVTNDYEYTVKIDTTAPTAQIVHCEHPEDVYYTHNLIKIKATDAASGVASVMLISKDVDHSHDIMTEAEVDEDGNYIWRFEETGNNVIEVIDNAGHKSEVPINVLIDKTQPTIAVNAYYYGEDENDKQDYYYDENGVGREINSAVYFEATATFGESGGEIRYSLDGGTTWKVLTAGGEGEVKGVLTVKTDGAMVTFRAVANTYNHPATDVAPYPNTRKIYTTWGEIVTVNIELEKIQITVGDITISDASKPFDGTDAFNGTITIRDDFASEKNINGEVTITSVKYASVNASDNAIALIIEVSCTDDTKVMDNQINGSEEAVGYITKRQIDVTVDSKEKIYGVKLPKLTGTAVGMVADFEEDILPYLYVVKPDGFTDELLPQNSAGYDITIDADATFDNYVINNVTVGKLVVKLAPIDRLVYEKGQFTGLDTKNIADRNLEIGFTRSNGKYEKLDVTFYSEGIVRDPDTNNVIASGYVIKVDDITKAGYGFFKVVISLPEKDSNGETLADKYYISEKLSKYEFLIKIINASIFDAVQKEPAKQESTPKVDEQDNQAKQDAPVLNNSANAQVGIYEDGYANADNTDMAIESTQKQKDYIAMISIFCAVAMTIAFAIGVGKAIQKRIRR